MATLSFQGMGKVIKGTVAVDLASVATVAVTEKAITITGALANDTVILNEAAAGITAGMVVCGARVSAADTVKVRVFNSTGGTVDEASQTWDYCLIRDTNS